VTIRFHRGDVIHGFAGGAFGSRSFECRRVLVVGPDYLVTRNVYGEVELCTGDNIPAPELADQRDFCDASCTGPAPLPEDVTALGGGQP
jgi:hypothetical protein